MAHHAGDLVLFLEAAVAAIAALAVGPRIAAVLEPIWVHTRAHNAIPHGLPHRLFLTLVRQYYLGGTSGRGQHNGSSYANPRLLRALKSHAVFE